MIGQQFFSAHRCDSWERVRDRG